MNRDWLSHKQWLIVSKTMLCIVQNYSFVCSATIHGTGSGYIHVSDSPFMYWHCLLQKTRNCYKCFSFIFVFFCSLHITENNTMYANIIHIKWLHCYAILPFGFRAAHGLWPWNGPPSMQDILLPTCMWLILMLSRHGMNSQATSEALNSCTCIATSLLAVNCVCLGFWLVFSLNVTSSTWTSFGPAKNTIVAC